MRRWTQRIRMTCEVNRARNRSACPVGYLRDFGVHRPRGRFPDRRHFGNRVDPDYPDSASVVRPPVRTGPVLVGGTVRILTITAVLLAAAAGCTSRAELISVREGMDRGTRTIRAQHADWAEKLTVDPATGR